MTRALIAVFLAALTLPLCAQSPSLGEVRTIYVAPMAGGFDTYIVGELLRRLPKDVTVTQSKDHADAILMGTGRSNGSGIGGTINQAIGLGGGASGAVELVTSQGAVLWADEKSDHTIPVFGTFREHGPSKVAARIAKDLSDALKKAEKKDKKG